MPFETFYYPYTAIHSVDSLKVALLYFDKVWTLSPRLAYSGRMRYRSETQQAFEELSSLDMVKMIDPVDVIERYEETLSSFIEDDLASTTFKKLRGPPFRLYLSKVPRRILRRFSDYGVEPHGEMIVVPFQLGESVILNYALLLSSQHGLIPFTDESIHNRALSTKIRAIQENMGIYAKPIKFRISLPAISGLNMEDILDIRKMSDFRSMRDSLNLFSTIVQNQPLSPLLWITISKHLDKIQELSHSVFSQFDEVLRAREAIIVKVPMTFSIFVAVSLVGTSFTPNNNLTSVFIDSQKLLPDAKTIKNIPQMLRTTIQGEPKRIERGAAHLSSFFSVLKPEED